MSIIGKRYKYIVAGKLYEFVFEVSAERSDCSDGVVVSGAKNGSETVGQKRSGYGAGYCKNWTLLSGQEAE